MSTIDLKYTCGHEGCEVKDVIVSVPERNPDTHDVSQWLQFVAVPVLVVDHMKRAPLCKTQSFKEIFIPTNHGEAHPVGTNPPSALN